MKIDKLLILSDLDEVSLPLLRYGLALADHLGAEVWVQYVYHITAHVSGDMYISPNMLESYEKRVLQEYDGVKKEIPELAKAHFVLSQGELVVEMNQLIDAEQIKLVLMGNRSSGFLTNILGSNANKVIQHSHCPVLSLPLEMDFEPFRKLAFALDLQETPKEAIAYIRDFASAFQSRVDIIHVSTAPVPVDVSQMVRLLDNKLEGVRHQFFHIKSEEVEEAIERHAEGNSIDLVVLLPRVHSFFDQLFQKSISRQAAYQKKTPLLTIHC
jgi:nucleotide-binding universal stress UspA family protein